MLFNFTHSVILPFTVYSIVNNSPSLKTTVKSAGMNCAYHGDSASGTVRIWSFWISSIVPIVSEFAFDNAKLQSKYSFNAYVIRILLKETFPSSCTAKIEGSKLHGEQKLYKVSLCHWWKHSCNSPYCTYYIYNFNSLGRDLMKIAFHNLRIAVSFLCLLLSY